MLKKRKIDKIPTEFLLSQNYPNPFNPTTTIKYSIPSDTKIEIQDVRLMIYNILGREVVTIVNERQKPGNYEIEWNSNNRPSGVYFL